MKSTATHVTSPRKLSLPRRLGLLDRGGLLLGGARGSRRARTAVERGHLLLHVHLQLVLLVKRHERLVTLLLELVRRHGDVARALRSDHLLLMGLDRGLVEVRRVGSRTVPRVATVRRLRRVA